MAHLTGVADASCSSSRVSLPGLLLESIYLFTLHETPAPPGSQLLDTTSNYSKNFISAGGKCWVSSCLLPLDEASSLSPALA